MPIARFPTFTIPGSGIPAAKSGIARYGCAKLTSELFVTEYWKIDP